MARRKGSSVSIHYYLQNDALKLLRSESKRLGMRPGQFLSALVLERSATFTSRPLQFIGK
jgi:hypothetical protein